MAGINRIGLGTVLTLALLAGCGKSSTSNGAAAASADASQPAAQAAASSNPIVVAASDWLDALLKGDKARLSARLTPQAQQQIVTSQTELSPAGGMQTASFQIGEVRTPSPDQAIVQCMLNDNANGKPRSEEACCLLRFVDNEWRVAGIAYGTAPDKPWMLTNFETGQDVPIPRQAMSGSAPSAADAGGVASRPSPPAAGQGTQQQIR